MVRRRFFSAVSNHGLRSASEPSFETPRKERGSSEPDRKKKVE
jgi:hypothetical protein